MNEKIELNKLRLLVEDADTKLKLGVITEEEHQEMLSVIDFKLTKLENQKKKKWFRKGKNEKES